MLSHVTLWLCVILCVCHVSAQPRSGLAAHQMPDAPPPCLNGVINAYTPVLGFGCDSSSLQVGPLTGFSTGDKVLLLQMQVPQVDLSNTSGFGDLLNATCIGNYEFNRILSINGNNIQLKFNLTRPYDISGRVQLVRVPEYDSATVCAITCLPWNGSIGGVLALDVKTLLTMTGNIDVSGKGFRGGIVEPNFIDWFFGEQEYFYPPVTTLAAQKGEGIVLIPLDHSYGRGRAGNGGGGGNAHNGGGGGGGNAGFGGDGGLEITNLPATPTPNTNGIGGTKYFDNNSSRALLGGGGGAGHANDALGTSGGNGGGMVFIQANTVQANNFRILANGIDIFGGIDQNDGQGGGGGGGTILLDIPQVNGVLNCDLKGGRGGSNPYTPIFQLHGPGGGGGGGKLLLPQNSPNINAQLQGGINGLTSQNLTNGALPGSPGTKLTGFTTPEGTAFAHPVSSNMVFSLQPPLCSGLSNGQIGIFQSSALAFQLNGGSWQSDSLFTNLPSGNYQISLQFAGGCTLDTTAILTTTPPVLEMLVQKTEATCVSGGELVLQAISGTPPFEFQANSGPWQPSGTFTGLLPGMYSITLRDAAGCTHVSNYAITAPGPAEQTFLLQQDATCIAGGEIAVAAAAGTAPFEFQLNNSAWQASGQFSSLAPGDYTVTLRDAAGCTQAEMYTIAAAPAVSDTLLEQVNASCLSGGSISIQALAGTAPFDYQLNGTGWQGTGLFGNLAPGIYSITLRDGAGCTKISNFSIAAPPPLKDTLMTLTNATCVAGGQLTLQTISGTAPFEYQLNGGAWQPGGAFNNLMPGNYSITIRDGAGCMQTASYPILAAPPLIDTLLSKTNATCVAGGQLTFQAISGTAPFEYQLNAGAWQPNGAFNNLAAGNYTITVRDGAGCAQTSNYPILAAPILKDSLLTLVDATCVEGGRLVTTAVTGTQPFEFQLNGGNWQPGGAFDNLAPGAYTVILRDGAGCTQASNFTITAPPPAMDSLLTLLEASCIAGGRLTVSVISGTSPFEFQLNGSGWQPSGTFDNLLPGMYVVTLRDGAGCTHTNSYAIEAPPPLNASLLMLSNATCIAGGQIAVSAVSGTMPFEYQISGNAWQSSGNFINLAPGAYTITLRDGAGCTQTATYSILAPPLVRDTLISKTEVGCHTQGKLVFQALSGTPPYQYQLNAGAWQTNGVFTNLPSGTYTVVLSDGAGCTFASFQTIAPYIPLTLKLDSMGVVDCRHETGFLSVSAAGGAGNYQFELSNKVLDQATGYFPAIKAGLYNMIVTDSLGCEAVLANLEIPNHIDSALTMETIILYEGSYYTLPDGSQTRRPGQYPFQYQTTEGCDSLHIIEVQVLKRHVYVPNIFSPNDDGENDFFTIYSDASLEKVEMLQVFDRWGELVFENRDFVPNTAQNGWDGLFRGRPVNPGVFAWLAKLTFVDGLQVVLKGDVTVFR